MVRVAFLRDLSLEGHLALAVLRSGHGTAETMVSLLQMLYLTYFMLGTACPEADVALFREAETVLDSSISAAAQGHGWQVSTEQTVTVGLVASRYDEVLGSVPKYRYIESCDRLCRFFHSAATSPLPDSQLLRRK
ncbi:hypothetical protein [Paraburkholderia sp. Cpub6]|uniref:hypothetical protein n=1 Tax=Paraburkholderia sp. Cpub6 TaxID=2723094 RepID=UPI0017C959CD|nr:hypothetical protein [Paraburkholderia sp. Cpub6]MBB5460514.1 hypothetical protein [Paraburkholderia sp. Cpub6]